MGCSSMYVAHDAQVNAQRMENSSEPFSLIYGCIHLSIFKVGVYHPSCKLKQLRLSYSTEANKMHHINLTLKVIFPFYKATTQTLE